ncbi:MAG: alkane 1-monooxygenase [Acidimicrobiales bacterium]|nr:alkane 1-monooxygenase [Acidimicrobiales bacterium]
MAAITATVDGEVQTYRDRRKPLYLLSLVVPLLTFGARREVERWGIDLLWYLGPIWVLVLIPIVDTLIGTQKENAPEWAEEAMERDRWYRYLTYLYAPLQYLGFFWACWYVASHDLSWFAELGLALTVGTVGGIGIANAHELGHKKARIERWWAKVVLAQTGYGHFEIEHNRGHHVRVATPEDPASARFGESFWAFFPRSVVGAARSGWELERKRLAFQGKGPWRWDNDVLNAWAMSVLLFGGVVVAFGPRMIPFLVVQAVFGFSLLEVVNYLEHYGLQREQRPDGRYERVRPEHSWNSDHIATNLLLYGLERHSDHHANPTRRYQVLRTFDEAPQLPSGYGTMIGLAYCTPLWRRVMDPKVLAVYDGDITRVNVDPRKRDRIYARYGVPATA